MIENGRGSCIVVRDCKSSSASLVSNESIGVDLLTHGKVSSRIVNIRRQSYILVSAFSEGLTLLEYAYGYFLESS